MVARNGDVTLIRLIGAIALFIAAQGLVAPDAVVAQEATTTIGLERAFGELRFARPVLLTHAGDDTNRIFVVEQGGIIRVFPNSFNAQSGRMFLDMRGRVNTSGEEQGLLGLAFDPDFRTNGYFYVYYTAPQSYNTILSRFAMTVDPNIADPGSEMQVLKFDQPFRNHNGGMIAFGPDGYLYVGLGDGGSAGDPRGHGQDNGTLLGSILRIDVSKTKLGEPYAIPRNNPFFESQAVPVPGQTMPRPEIWAYGLRNPWRFSFDRETGDLWAGDVGQDAWEEIDIIRSGANYGWNVLEGTHCYREETCSTDGLEPPVVEYPNSEKECAVTGGYVYRGKRLRALQGHYLFSDYCSGRIWALRHESGLVSGPKEIVAAPFRTASFGEDEYGEVYVLGFDGLVYGLTATSEEPVLPIPTPPPPPELRPSPTPTPPQPLVVRSTPTPVPTPTATPLPPGAPTPTPTATPLPPGSPTATPTPTPLPPGVPAPTPTATPFAGFVLPFEGAPGLGLTIMALIGFAAVAIVIFSRIRGEP